MSLYEKLKIYGWPFLLIIPLLALIGVIKLVLPPAFQPFFWPVAVIISSLTTLLVRELIMPEAVKQKVQFWVRKNRKRLSPPELSLRFTTRYHLLEPAGKQEVVDLLEARLETAMEGPDHVEFLEESSYGRITKRITLDTSQVSMTPDTFAPSGSGVGMSQQEDGEQVTDIRVKLEIESSYSNLHSALLTMFEREGELQTVFSPLGIESEGYGVACEFQSPPVLDVLMKELDINRIQARTEQNLDLRITQDEIRVRNIGGNELPQVLDQIEKIVTYYG